MGKSYSSQSPFLQYMKNKNFDPHVQSKSLLSRFKILQNRETKQKHQTWNKNQLQWHTENVQRDQRQVKFERSSRHPLAAKYPIMRHAHPSFPQHPAHPLNKERSVKIPGNSGLLVGAVR